MKPTDLGVFGAVVIVGLLGGTSVTAQLAHAAQGGTGTTPLQKASPFLDKLLPASRPGRAEHVLQGPLASDGQHVGHLDVFSRGDVLPLLSGHFGQ